MEPELQKIKNYLSSLNFSLDTFANLSKSDKGEELVSDTETAFCFDKISNSFYKHNLHSADALLLKNKNLYLIEFKRVEHIIGKEKEILRLKLFLKMAESFHTLLNWVFINSKADPSKFEKWFILVTEHKDDPLATTTSAYNRLSQGSVNSNALTNKSFGKYMQQYKKNKIKVYYDYVYVWAASVFSKKIMKLK